MLSLDKAGIDKLLLQLEDIGFIDPRYKFYKVNNELNLLGRGGFSYVYEMYDSMAPERHYAAKIIGIGKDVDEQLILETTRIQYFLSEQSDNIMRVIALWIMKLHLDDEGNVVNIVGVNQEGYEEDDGIHFEIVLMEKLDDVISKDKYGNVELKREDLKSEEGVIKFAENIGRALFTVHNNRFLHRDIKLENIFWDNDLQQYKLGDFGIARYVGEGEAETVVFTDGYGAPEIERQLEESYNLTADVYSFGITIYLLLNDLRFPASDGYHANIVQYSKDFVMPAPANASEEMARIIRKMCSYRMQDRYQSVEEVLMDIGRIDGSYTDEGFTEYEDLETVTYTEGIADDEEDILTETYREPKADDSDVEKDEEEIPWWRKDESELTREERKEKLQSEKEIYSSSSIWRMVITAILVAFLLKAFSPDASYLNRWEFWIVPFSLFVASVLQRVKEFHVEWAAFTVGVAGFSMYYLGVGVPQIVAIITVLIGIPSITAGTSIGMGLWMAQMLTGKFAWLNFLSRWDLGWIVLIALVAVLESCLLLRLDYRKANNTESIIQWILDKIWYLMIIAGVILLILGHFNVIEIPSILKHIHLVRTGIGFWLVEVAYLWYYGLLDDEEDIVDESVDE